MRPSTFEGYRAYVRDKIVPYLGDKEIRKVTAGDVQKLYRKLKKEGGAAGGPLAGGSGTTSSIWKLPQDCGGENCVG